MVAKGAASATFQGEVKTYPRALLSVARRFIDQGDFSIAVVVAHMACEVATERRLSEAFATKGIDYLEDAVTDFFSGYNLNNEKIRNLYVALTGDHVHDTTFWSNFKVSAARRNKIIHNALGVGATEAEESYKAATDFLNHLKF
jgi:hypothetical protein